MNNIKICYWNANGLSQHKCEVEVFLKLHNVQILLISETHFTPKNCFRIKGYTTYDTKHPSGRACGGSAILIQNNINHFLKPEYKSEYIQATSVYLSDLHLTISSVYSPPRHNIQKEQYTQFFQTLGNKFIAAGDYNAKHLYWGSRLTSPKGRQLLQAISNLNLDVVSSGRPTHWPSDPNKIPDLIDFAILNNIRREQLFLESSYDLSSDHSPVFVTYTFLPMRVDTISYPNKRTKWPKYKAYVNTHLSLNIPLRTETDLQLAIDSFNDIVATAVQKFTPNSKNNRKHNSYPRSITDLISEKRELRRQWQRFRSPGLKISLKHCQRNLHRALVNFKEESLKQYLSSLDSTPKSEYSLWKSVKYLKRPTKLQSPIRMPDGSWAKSDSEISNAFANHLEKVFTPHQTNLGETLPPTNNNSHYRPIKMRIHTIKNLIKQLDEKKSPGPDKITAKMIKELPDKAQYYILYIFNAMLRIEYFPNSWKNSEIKMVPKPGKDPTQITSYRPISLLSILSKLFEKSLMHYLNPVIASQNLIPHHQFGFRKKHSTIEQIHRIVTLIRSTFEQKQYCTSLFIDISQAFDKVWHKGLIHKITQLLPPCTHKILTSYLNNRTFVVKTNNCISNPNPISAGVPQGSILGPFLYTLYTADMPTHLLTHTATFADDTALLSIHKNHLVASQQLQAHIGILENWLELWRIQVNPSKCVHVTFTLNKSCCPKISVNGSIVPEKTQVKYLGIHLDRRLTWGPHIDAKLTQIKLKLSQLNWLLNAHSHLSLDNKIILYKSMIKPIWTYGIQLWGTASASNVEKLQRRQSKFLRQITQAPWYVRNVNIHKDLNIPTVNEEIKTYCSKYIAKITSHPNPLAQDLLLFGGHTRLKRVDTIRLATNT